ncbi:hypothetical protein MPLB_100030 [Mesorhizobium sp. ORS 3324]|nr:hypothetical protein MPLB_100030 [Mesorhizobium sp. ORS 3324]
MQSLTVYIAVHKILRSITYVIYNCKISLQLLGCCWVERAAISAQALVTGFNSNLARCLLHHWHKKPIAL